MKAVRLGLFLLVTGSLSAQAPILIELADSQYDSSTGEGSIAIVLTSSVPFAGFQFDLVFDPVGPQLTGATGGLAETLGFTVGIGAMSGTVLGYTLTLTEIPATDPPETLTVITYNCDLCLGGAPGDAPEICLANPVFADVSATPIASDVGPCLRPGGGPLYLRGDCNTDGDLNVADAVFLLANLFAGGPISTCVDGCDSNDDGLLDIADAVFELAFLFSGGAAPPAPGVFSCGVDPTDDGLDCLTPGPCP